MYVHVYVYVFTYLQQPFSRKMYDVKEVNFVMEQSADFFLQKVVSHSDASILIWFLHSATLK